MSKFVNVMPDNLMPQKDMLPRDLGYSEEIDFWPRDELNSTTRYARYSRSDDMPASDAHYCE